MLTQEIVRKYFSYDPKTGDLNRIGYDDSWGNFHICNRKINGKSSGYIVVRFKNKCYKAHRLIFMYMLGYIPEYIDHINGNRSDNSWKNLRGVTLEENLLNKRTYKNNSSGQSGIHWEANMGKYRVRIQKNGKRDCLGFFDDLEEAISVRKKAEIDYGFHENHGKTLQ